MSANGIGENGNKNLLSGGDLRFLFVSFLFGLAAAEVAIKVSDLVLKSNLFPTETFWALLTHLIMAIVLISTSWVGWSTSQSSKKYIGVPGVYSKQFCILLIDVILVIFYFILVRSVGITGKDQLVEANSLLSVKVPTLLVFFIFSLYALWDIITKWGEIGFWKRSKWSFICCSVSLTIWIFLNEVNTFYSVELVYLSLLFLDLSFRAFKQGKEDEYNVVSKILGWGLFIGVIALASLAYYI